MTVDPATDLLSVFAPLTLEKLFVDDPVAPGETVALEFTVSNTSDQDNITAIEFTDDLDAILSGLAATGLPAADVCGAGSEITGTGFLTFTGGSLAPASSCTFSVDVDVPVETLSPTTVTNVTSEVTGMLGGLATTGLPATDDLTVEESICTAPDGENLVLADDTVDGVETFTVCEAIEIGPNYAVVGPNGSLTVRAGKEVIVLNDTSVGQDAELTIGLDPELQP